MCTHKKILTFKLYRRSDDIWLSHNKHLKMVIHENIKILVIKIIETLNRYKMPAFIYCQKFVVSNWNDLASL